jgi:hypothetical protein
MNSIKKPLVIHLTLMKLIKQPDDDRPDEDDLQEGQTNYYNWHPVHAPAIYKDTTVIQFADQLRRNEESFEGNRIFGWARTYPIDATHPSEIHQVEFKVELKRETVQSVFWHIIFYARNESWVKREDAPPMVSFYETEV